MEKRSGKLTIDYLMDSAWDIEMFGDGPSRFEHVQLFRNSKEPRLHMRWSTADRRIDNGTRVYPVDGGNEHETVQAAIDEINKMDGYA